MTTKQRNPLELVCLRSVLLKYHHFNKQFFLFPFRYQDVHTQSYIMVLASARWLGVRMTFLTTFLILAVALAAIVVSQDAGMYLLAVTVHLLN